MKTTVTKDENVLHIFYKPTGSWRVILQEMMTYAQKSYRFILPMNILKDLKEQIMSEKLELCPFCNSVDIELKGIGIGIPYIKCKKCGVVVHGGMGSESETINMWNRRPHE